MEKHFCEYCRKFVDIFVEETLLEGKISGEIYRYKGEVCYCKYCKQEIYDAKVSDENLARLYYSYRNINGIIPFHRK